MSINGKKGPCLIAVSIFCFINLFFGSHAMSQNALGTGNALDRNNNVLGRNNFQKPLYRDNFARYRYKNSSSPIFRKQSSMFNEVDETRNFEVLEYLGRRGAIFTQEKYGIQSNTYTGFSGIENSQFFAGNNPRYSFNKNFQNKSDNNYDEKKLSVGTLGFNERVLSYNQREAIIGTKSTEMLRKSNPVYFGFEKISSGLSSPTFVSRSLTGMRKISDPLNYSNSNLYDKARLVEDIKSGIDLVKKTWGSHGYGKFMEFALDNKSLSVNGPNIQSETSSLGESSKYIKSQSPHMYAIQSLANVYLPEKGRADASLILKRDYFRLKDELSLSFDIETFDEELKYTNIDNDNFSEDKMFTKENGVDEKIKNKISTSEIKQFGQAVRLAEINLATLADERHGYLGELTKSAEEALKNKSYLWSEWKFEHVLRLMPDYPMALAGLVQARVGGEMFVSASLTLEKLISEYPEMAGTKLDMKILPAKEEWPRLYLQLKDLIDQSHYSVEVRDGIYLLIAYQGWQLGYKELIQEGLQGYEKYVGGDNSLFLLVKEIWLNTK